MEGAKNAYRIRFGNYRVGFYLEGDSIILSRVAMWTTYVAAAGMPIRELTTHCTDLRPLMAAKQLTVRPLNWIKNY